MRTLSHDQQRWLEQEIAVWESQGVIESDAASRIRSLYTLQDGDANSVSPVKAWLVSVAVMTTLSLAALLAGLAVLLVVCYNWDAMIWQEKLAILIGSLLAANVGGLVLRIRNQENYSEVAFFFGSILFGVCIWQIAQIFHIRAHYPEGMLMWACGVLPIALCARTPLLHALAALLLSIWCGWEVLGYERGLFMFHVFGTEWSIDYGAYPLPFLASLGLVWGYWKRSEIVVGFYAATIIWWLCLACDTLNLRWAGCWYILLVGVFAAYIGEWHKTWCGGRFAKLARPWQLIGTRLAAATLVPMTFWQFHAEMQNYYGRSLQWGSSFDVFIYLSNCVVMAIAVFVFLAIAYIAARQTWRQCARETSDSSSASSAMDGRWLPPAIFACCGVAALLSLVQMTDATFISDFRYNVVRPDNILTAGPVIFSFVLAINAAMVLSAFYLILRGLTRQYMSVYIAGVCYFLLWVVLRYFDLFGGQGAGAMLGAAALFFLCAVALAGTVIFWVRRKT
ncbi:MAG: DUF2157 domain-containing protein [Thermoguttaceae bacterium]